MSLGQIKNIILQVEGVDEKYAGEIVEKLKDKYGEHSRLYFYRKSFDNGITWFDIDLSQEILWDIENKLNNKFEDEIEENPISLNKLSEGDSIKKDWVDKNSYNIILSSINDSSGDVKVVKCDSEYYQISFIAGKIHIESVGLELRFKETQEFNRKSPRKGEGEKVNKVGNLVIKDDLKATYNGNDGKYWIE